MLTLQEGIPFARPPLLIVKLISSFSHTAPEFIDTLTSANRCPIHVQIDTVHIISRRLQQKRTHNNIGKKEGGVRNKRRVNLFFFFAYFRAM